MKRRDLLRFATASLALAYLPAQSSSKLTNKKLVVFILEGGMDGLSAVIPIGEGRLESYRQELVPRDHLTLSRYWALDPAFQSTYKLFSAGHALAIHATSFPYTLRSHFEGQNFIQGGGSSPFSEKTGWLGRALDLAGLGGRAMSLDTPLILRGATALDNFFPSAIPNTPTPSLELLNALDKELSPEWQVVNKVLQDKTKERYFTGRDRTPQGLSRQAGLALSLPNGPSIAVIKIGDFDTHAGQGREQGDRLQKNFKTLDECINNLRTTLGGEWSNTTFMTLTEFGRTVKMNGSFGTDHGYASALFVGGGSVNGGAVIADWPGLEKSDRFEGRDLMSTIDSRSICSEILTHTLGLDHDEIAERVFFDSSIPRLPVRLFV